MLSTADQTKYIDKNFRPTNFRSTSTAHYHSLRRNRDSLATANLHLFMDLTAVLVDAKVTKVLEKKDCEKSQLEDQF